jgi:hypothetical protein
MFFLQHKQDNTSSIIKHSVVSSPATWPTQQTAAASHVMMH